MPPPAAVGLFQTPSSAGPTAAALGPALETAFSNIRSYIQHANERRRAPLSLPNARGVSRHPALGYGGARGARSLYGAQDGRMPPSLLDAPAGQGHAETAGRAARGFGASARAGARYGGPNSPPTASGIGMDWRAPQSGPGILLPGMKRTRDNAEMDMHARELGRSTVARLAGPGDAPRVAPGGMPAGTPAGSSLKATPGASSGKNIAASAVTTDTARRILQTLDRLAGQKSGTETNGAAASPLAKPTNLSSSLNKAAAPSSSLHGFRGIQRATPAKALASAEKRVSAPIASHSKPTPTPVTRPSVLQFEPDAFKEKKTPPAPAIEFGKTASAAAAAAKPVAPPAPLFSAPAPSKSADDASTTCLPVFSFGDASPVTASPLATSSVSSFDAGEMPKYTFGEDDEDEPKYTFGGSDDGMIDAPGMGSPVVPEIDVKYTFSTGVAASALPSTSASVSAPTFSLAAAPAKGGLWSAEGLKENAEHMKKVDAAIEEEEGKGKAKPAAPAAPAIVAAPKAGGLWSADALKKNAEHQQKVNAAIEEEESKAKGGAPAPAAAPAPSPFATPSATTAAPATFSFGFAPAKTDAAPAAPAAFSFGLPPAEKSKEHEKPAAAEPPVPAPGAFTFGGPAPNFGKTAAGKPADTPAAPAAAPFTFGAPAEKKVEEPEKPAEKPDAPAPASAPFTFGATTPASSSPLSAAAPAFMFGAVPKPKAAEEPASAPVPTFTGFGAAATDAKDAAPHAPAPAAFTFGGAPASTSVAPVAPVAAPSLFDGASSGSLAALGAAADAAPAPAPFTFGGSSAGSGFGAATAAAATETAPTTTRGAFTFGGAPTASTDPVSTFGAAPAAPAFGAAASTPAFGSTPAPAFGVPSSTPAFGADAAPAAAPAAASGGFGGGGFGFGASQPAAPASGSFTFGASTGAAAEPAAPSATPFGSSSGGFGASAAPAFGAAAANPIGGDAPAPAAAPGPFGFDASATSAFGSSGSLGGFGAPASTSAPAAAANPFGGGSPAFGAPAGNAPAFGGGGGFGGGAPPPINTPSMFGGGVPGGGMSMGAGDAPRGGRKPVKKARRPPKRN